MGHATTVFVVDQDPACRDAVAAAAASLGLGAEAYPSAEAFLRRLRDEPGCLVAEMPPDRNHGFAWQDELRRRGSPLPLVLLAARPTTHAVVRAMQAGAFFVVEKPWTDGQLVQAVREAVALDRQRRLERSQQDEFQARLASLTAKEREVLGMMMTGKANKTMATLLGASLRTVENRRRSIFAKLGAKSVAELVTIVLGAEGA